MMYAPIQNSLNKIVKANLDRNDVEKIALDLYGLNVVNLFELNGYDDKNYRIFTQENGLESKSFVLKVVNSLDSENEGLFVAQSLLLEHLGKKQICCPRPILTRDGKFLNKIKLRNAEHIVRMLEYIDGSILHNVTCTPQLLYQIGEFAARIDDAMKDFVHEAFGTCDSIWKLESVPRLTSYLLAIKDSKDRRLVETIIEEFQNRVLTVSGTFDTGLIHGDLNEQNIVLKCLDESGEYKIEAVIDFGDCHNSCYLFELAITMAYMILQAQNIRAGAHILAGYESIRKVPDVEYSLLVICIEARLCQSLVLGAYSSIQDPDNKYILITAERGWKTLRELRNMPEGKLLQDWKAAAEII